MASHNLVDSFRNFECEILQNKSNRSPLPALLLNWTMYYGLGENIQEPSPPSPAVTEFADFRYFLTASVRPRT